MPSEHSDAAEEAQRASVLWRILAGGDPVEGCGTLSDESKGASCLRG